MSTSVPVPSKAVTVLCWVAVPIYAISALIIAVYSVLTLFDASAKDTLGMILFLGWLFPPVLFAHIVFLGQTIRQSMGARAAQPSEQSRRTLRRAFYIFLGVFVLGLITLLVR